MTELDVLIAARDLIARPGGWTQGYIARLGDDRPCTYEYSYAAKFCLAGAVAKVALHIRPLTQFTALFHWLDEFAGGSLTRWNDAPERTQADVVALLDRAIEAWRDKHSNA